MRLRDESGFTLVEVLVALALLGAAVVGTVAVLDSSRHLTTVAESEAVASTVGERELERLSAQPFAKLALAAPPSSSASPSDPRYYVQTSAGTACPSTADPPAPPCYQWDQSGAASATNTEPLVVDAANADTTANPQPWSAPAPGGGSRLSGTIYRFVTWAHDFHCTTGSCDATKGYKRVTVAVTVDNSRLTRPIIASTLVGDTAGGAANPLTDAGTTCSDDGTPEACVN